MLDLRHLPQAVGIYNNVGTTCGVNWSMYFPLIDRPQEHGIDWGRGMACGDYTDLNNPVNVHEYPYEMSPDARFVLGTYGSVQAGPLEVQFATGVKNVRVLVTDMGNQYNPAITGEGAYMVAYDAAGQEIGRRTFIPGGASVGCPPWAEETISVGAIRKLIVHPSWGSGSPPASGTNGSVDQVEYSIVFEVSGELRVSCPSTERGQTVTCSASTFPVPRPFTVESWEFTSPELSAPITETSTAIQWTGKGVLSGVVNVTGTVDGTRQTAQGTLTVTPRDWSQDTVRFRIEEVPQAEFNLPVRPLRVGNLGGTANLGDSLPPFDGVDQVQGGPNHEVFYLTKIPVEGLSKIAINRIALGQNSEFYNLQPLTARGNNCGKPDVLRFLPLVEQHEGLGSPPPSNSHAGVFRIELNRLSQTAEDIVVLRDRDLLDVKTGQRIGPRIRNAQAVARDRENGGTVDPVPFCTFKYFK